MAAWSDTVGLNFAGRVGRTFIGAPSSRDGYAVMSHKGVAQWQRSDALPEAGEPDLGRALFALDAIEALTLPTRQGIPFFRTPRVGEAFLWGLTGDWEESLP